MATQMTSLYPVLRGNTSQVQGIKPVKAFSQNIHELQNLRTNHWGHNIFKHWHSFYYFSCLLKHYIYSLGDSFHYKLSFSLRIFT